MWCHIGMITGAGNCHMRARCWNCLSSIPRFLDACIPEELAPRTYGESSQPPKLPRKFVSDIRVKRHVFCIFKRKPSLWRASLKEPQIWVRFKATFAMNCKRHVAFIVWMQSKKTAHSGFCLWVPRKRLVDNTMHVRLWWFDHSKECMNVSEATLLRVGESSYVQYTSLSETPSWLRDVEKLSFTSSFHND